MKAGEKWWGEKMHVSRDTNDVTAVNWVQVNIYIWWDRKEEEDHGERQTHTI